MRTRTLAGAAATALAFSLLAGSPALAHDKPRHGDGQGNIKVTTTKDTVDEDLGDGTCADEWGKCSLRAAVQHANAAGGGTIELGRKAHYLLTVANVENADADGENGSATGDLDVTTGVTTKGNGAVVDAQGIDRVFDVLASASLTLEYVTVTGGVALGEGLPASGGGVRNAGTLDVDRSTITRNSAPRAGGGIEASPESATTISRSTLSENATGAGPGNGGGLHLTGAGTVHVERSHVTGNTAAAEGGGLWNSGMGTMTVDRSTISGNTASGAEATMGGGGLFQDAGATGTLTVTRSEITHNSADGAAGSGGGILNDQGTLVVERSSISGNSAVRAGGGIEANVGTTTLHRTHLDGNTTGAGPGNGGGLHLTGAGTVHVERSHVTGNTAAAEGGGLWNSGMGTMTVDRSTISGNTASGAEATMGGGGLFQDAGATGTLTVTRSEITHNSADGAAGSGGGILNDQGTLVVERSSISGNSAVRAGGGIEANVGTTTLHRTHLDGNTTGAGPGNGGGLHLTGAGTVLIERGSVTGNTAANDGGGLWNSPTGTMTVERTKIRGNHADGEGDDVYQEVGRDGNATGTFTVDGQLVPAGG